MALTPYAGPIGPSYNGQELAMVTATAGLSLAEYPVHVSQEQFGAIKRQDQVFGILANTVKLPSEQAGISDALFPITQAIDSLHRSAMHSYRENFIRANRLDRQRIRELEAFPGAWPRRWAIRAFRFLSRHHQRVVQPAGSAQRYAWMVEVGALEEQRISTIKAHIEERVVALIATIQQEAAQDFIQTHSVQELDQLSRLFHSQLPGILIVEMSDGCAFDVDYFLNSERN